MTAPSPSRTVTADLARAIHARRDGFHGPYTDRCVCNSDAEIILRGAAKLVPQPDPQAIIREWTALPVSPTDGLDELRALSERATPGPWRVVPENWEFHEHIVGPEDDAGWEPHVPGFNDDAAFIVKAVEYVRARLEVTRESE